MASLVAAVLGRRFETSVRWLAIVSKMQLQQARKLRFSWLPYQPWLRSTVNILPQNAPMMATSACAVKSEELMLFSEKSPDEGSRSGGSGGAERPPRPLRLMDYKKLRWPNPIKLLKNYLFAALIQISFDKEFSMNGFLAGAEQVIWVSHSKVILCSDFRFLQPPELYINTLSWGAKRGAIFWGCACGIWGLDTFWGKCLRH